MFPARYFPNRYFAPRYWPKLGAAIVPTDDTNRRHGDSQGPAGGARDSIAYAGGQRRLVISGGGRRST